MIIPQLGGQFNLPTVSNEPIRDFSVNSIDRLMLKSALDEMLGSAPFNVPLVINGERISHSASPGKQEIGCCHARFLCHYAEATTQHVSMAIDGCLARKDAWESMPFNDRCAVFLKAADLISGKWRYKLMAATMLGQGKSIHQAEIDASAELIDFLRFNCHFAAQIYATQPAVSGNGASAVWNRMEYRALEGFVLAVSPFNFTAIGGNLVCAPALMGNVVLWKPSPLAIYSNYLIYCILEEAGLPPGVIQFIPGPAPAIVSQAISHPLFSGLHFTGSTLIFKKLWLEIAQNLAKDVYIGFPRLVGETGGKNLHFVHSSADVTQVARQTLRSAFEYAGQKCSACSRLFVPDGLWERVKAAMLAEMKGMKVGSVLDFENMVNNVVGRASFDKIKGILDHVKAHPDEAEIIAGGGCNDSVGYFIEPTIIVCRDVGFKTMHEEIFGPVLSVFVYPAAEYEKYLGIADKCAYALTASLFATDRQAIILGSNLLRNAAGNFYVNDKCTGAVVGQQPFGGARMSGTNDKAGAACNLGRWVSIRTVKESFGGIEGVGYASNVV